MCEFNNLPKQNSFSYLTPAFTLIRQTRANQCGSWMTVQKTSHLRKTVAGRSSWRRKGGGGGGVKNNYQAGLVFFPWTLRLPGHYCRSA